MTAWKPGDRVILSTQESRGVGSVVADSVIEGRVIVEWDAPCGKNCADDDCHLTTIPLTHLLIAAEAAAEAGALNV